jgi:transglutaminase-like putative cysteine protease
MSTPRLAVPIALFVLFTIPLSAQDPPVEWGEIPTEHLTMKSFSPDTNAAALILCDFGETSLNNELHLVFTRHMRIKIFSERAYDAWGSHSVAVDESDDGEILTLLEGATYVIDVDGDIEEYELDDDMIFKEKTTGDRYRYRFTFPALAPGCVVEFRYTIECKNWSWVRDWNFQYNEPILWSEYRLRHPRVIGYAAVVRGPLRLDINEHQEVNQFFAGRAIGYLGSKITKCNQRRWVLKNAPALRDEPYLTNLDDYRVHLNLQLSGYALPGLGVRQVLHDWPTVIAELLDSDYFGNRIDPGGDVKELVEQITAGMTSPRDKLKAIYNWIATSIVLDPQETVPPKRDMEDIIESKRGEKNDIVFLLVSMLRSASIQTDPVILSTRSNGLITDMYPLINQFNYILARAIIGSTQYFLDATDPLRPYDLLPMKVLDVRGLVLKKGSVEWVTISSPKRYHVTGSALIKVRSDGGISGVLQCLYRDYAGFRIRGRLRDETPLDLAKSLYEADALGFTVDSVMIVGQTSIESPVSIKTHISSTDYGQSAGNYLYMNPHILFRRRENPFKSPTRQFPVNYGYGYYLDGVVTITVPDESIIKESVGPRGYRLSGNEVSFTRLAELEGSRFQMKTRLVIKSSEIPPSLYGSLRELYAAMVEAQSELIVIDQSTAAARDRQ